ncbi:hypothetical protein AB0C34_11465 [Nocardia sp. NPDC049220]|uniref:hypothetical protein n=1 Tax=Nocardia sp. NPDC049220 TaxID=3155273 RepID=UPI0033ED7C59
MTDPYIDISLARAADFESWAAALLSEWWPVLTGDLPPPATTLRAWRATDHTAQVFRVEFVARQFAEPGVMRHAHAAFGALGMPPDRRELARSSGSHLVGSTEDAIVGLRFSGIAHTVFVRLQSRPCQVAPGAGTLLLSRAEAQLPFPNTTTGPLDVRVARNNARHLLTGHGAKYATAADPLQLGPPQRVVDLGWAFLFPWSTTSWYTHGVLPTLPPGTRGPIVVVKDSGHTWLLNSLSSFDAQLTAYARDRGYPVTRPGSETAGRNQGR